MKKYTEPNIEMIEYFTDDIIAASYYVEEYSDQSGIIRVSLFIFRNPYLRKELKYLKKCKKIAGIIAFGYGDFWDFSVVKSKTVNIVFKYYCFLAESRAFCTACIMALEL